MLPAAQPPPLAFSDPSDGNRPVRQNGSNAPIFIIGTERSGSNLLRLILNAHPSIHVPHPPHILKFFSPLVHRYGNLDERCNLEQLTTDICGLIAAHIYPWDAIPAAPDILRTAHPSLAGVFVAIYDLACKQAGKRRWGCKSTFVIDHIADVLKICPEARFLFLVRDPRDVALSSKRSIFSPFHPWYTAHLWHRQQQEGCRWAERFPEKFLLIRYEDLLDSPEQTVHTMCSFIGEDFDPAMLEFYRTKEARQSSRLSACWRNTAQPIQQKNHGRYKSLLSEKEITLIEGVCGSLMEKFAYPITKMGKQPDAVSRLGRFRFRLLDLFWKLCIEWRAAFSDRNYRLHWRRRFFLLKLKLRRQHRHWSAWRTLGSQP